MASRSTAGFAFLCTVQSSERGVGRGGAANRCRHVRGLPHAADRHGGLPHAAAANDWLLDKPLLPHAGSRRG